MGSKILGHEEALNIVYSVIAALRKEGKTKITISEVARISGVSRSTMNSKNTDWVEVRNVIQTNEFSEKVKLASDSIQERTKWQVEAARLKKDLQNCQELLDERTEFANKLYKRLLDELHKYVYRARKVPEHMDRESKNLIELHELRNQVEFYEAEIRSLKANQTKNGTVIPFAKKEVICIYAETQKADLSNLDFLDLTMDALYKLDDYFRNPHPPKVVYVLSGNFGSGKSAWIADHSPLYEGINIYFEGTSHSKVIRQRIIKHIRKYKTSCKIICVRILCDVEECLKRNTNDTRVRYNNDAPIEIINIIGENFEEITASEGFDEIIAVGGKHV